jgi:hypothetical protein
VYDCLVECGFYDFVVGVLQERDVKPMNNVVETRSGDLAEALARALAERSKAIHSEDDDDEDDSNDDEWED